MRFWSSSSLTYSRSWKYKKWRWGSPWKSNLQRHSWNSSKPSNWLLWIEWKLLVFLVKKTTHFDIICLQVLDINIPLLKESHLLRIGTIQWYICRGMPMVCVADYMDRVGVGIHVCRSAPVAECGFCLQLWASKLLREGTKLQQLDLLAFAPQC